MKDNHGITFAAIVRDTCNALPPEKRFAVQELEEFGNDCEMHGEKIIAAETVSRLNDKYYGQWLALNHPFRDLDSLQVAFCKCCTCSHRGNNKSNAHQNGDRVNKVWMMLLIVKR